MYLYLCNVEIVTALEPEAYFCRASRSRGLLMVVDERDSCRVVESAVTMRKMCDAVQNKRARVAFLLILSPLSILKLLSCMYERTTRGH